MWEGGGRVKYKARYFSRWVRRCRLAVICRGQKTPKGGGVGDDGMGWIMKCGALCSAREGPL